MIFYGLLLLELGIIFLTSRFLFQSLAIFLYRLTHSQKFTVVLLQLFFFPGVVIHELSHFLVAHALFVRAGNIEFVPQIRSNSVKLGSVQVEQTDLFRNFLIGVAPVLIGSMVITVLAWYAGQNFSIPSAFSAHEFWKYFLLGYGIFVTANTMFSSKKDLEGTVELLIVVAILGLTIYLLNHSILSFLVEKLTEKPALQSIQTVDSLLGLPLGINAVFSGILRAVVRRG